MNDFQAGSFCNTIQAFPHRLKNVDSGKYRINRRITPPLPSGKPSSRHFLIELLFLNKLSAKIPLINERIHLIRFYKVFVLPITIFFINLQKADKDKMQKYIHQLVIVRMQV